MSDIPIRRARESDFPVMAGLLEDLIRAMRSTEGIDIRIAVRNCRNLLNDAGSHLLVAEIEGTAVGFINFSVRHTILHRSACGVIDELVVAREYRGRGIGGQLVLSAVQECKRLGCCEVEVSSEKTNTRAKDFYRKCGFEEKGLLFEADLLST